MHVLLPNLLESSDLLETYDVSDSKQHSEVTCAFTLCGVTHCDARSFLQERLMAYHTPPSETGVLTEAREETQFLAAQQDLQNLDISDAPTCIRLAGCGHVFSGVPLLYELITRIFRCPLCRQGSAQVVDISHPCKIPDNVNPCLWRLLCFLARRARQLAQREQRNSSGLQISSQLSEHGPPGITFLVVEFEVFASSTP